MMRRGFGVFSLVCAVLCVALWAASAHACPMCNQSIAEQDRLPHAYMYSIIFMLAMPATVFTGLGTAIFFKFSQFNAHPQVGIAGDDLLARPDETTSPSTADRDGPA